VVYLPLVLLTWAGDAFFNLVLFLDPFGRLVLSRDERIGAVLVGTCVFGGLALGVGGLVAGSSAAAVVGMGLLALALPVGGTFTRPPRRRRMAALYTAGLTLVGTGAVVALALGRDDAAGTLGVAFALGVVGFTWLANLFTR